MLAINLAHLRVVTIVAQHGSVTEAASCLHRAQSAVTRSIQELEQTLGEKLFERRASGMLTTPVGQVVVARSNRVFAELDALAQWCAVRQSRKAAAIPTYLLNTRRLQLLISLAKHRHMPSAAQALGVSQPAVSSAIRILENGAGCSLFHRTARGLLLSTEGETFSLHVRRALNELRHVPDDIAALRGHITGQVHVGALPLGRTSILPRAVAAMLAHYPGVRIVTDESPYDTLVASLRAGDLDFILGALRPADPTNGLLSERLLSEGMVVLARKGHPLASVRRETHAMNDASSPPESAERERTPALTLRDLKDAQWILPRQHAPARSILEALFVRTRLKAPVAAVETADLAMIRGLLLSTDMIAALSARQLQYECDRGELVVLDVLLPNTQRDIGLTMRADGDPSPSARKLIEAIRRTVTLPDTGRDASASPGDAYPQSRVG